MLRRTLIQTVTESTIDPFSPKVDDIWIHDIATGLSRLCRFSGHTRHFYSVAQHSVLVSQLVPPALALWGLLHDASEAYLGDVPSPLKRLPCYREYREAEGRLLACIADRFGLGSPFPPPEVKIADTLALGAEVRDLMSPRLPIWQDCFLPPTWQIQTIIPFAPEEARVQFLNRFWSLYGADHSQGHCGQRQPERQPNHEHGAKVSEDHPCGILNPSDVQSEFGKLPSPTRQSSD